MALFYKDGKPRYGVLALLWIAALLFLLALPEVKADEIQVEWDAVPDDRVTEEGARYEVHWGMAPGDYDQMVETTSTTATVTEDRVGTVYIAARVNYKDRLFSEFSDEISVEVAEDKLSAPGDFRAILQITISRPNR